MTTLFKYLTLPMLSIAIVLTVAPICTADVVVIDRVTTVETPIRITVLTKGRFFSAGGRLVDVYIDDKHLKRILTGGDGYGYLKYTPQNPGYKTIKARSNSDSAEGLLLVMTKNEGAIVIEIEEGFKDAVMSSEVKQSSLKAVKTLSQKYKIIYLSRYAGKGIAGTWLENQNFPKSVIIKWRGSRTLAALNKKGVQLHAIIGSKAVISEAVKHVEKRFAFEKTKDGTTVTGWDDLLEKLQDKPGP
jgi:hypothetical protein